jgi:hypothetical protein
MSGRKTSRPSWDVEDVLGELREHMANHYKWFAFRTKSHRMIFDVCATSSRWVHSAPDGAACPNVLGG